MTLIAKTNIYCNQFKSTFRNVCDGHTTKAIVKNEAFAISIVLLTAISFISFSLTTLVSIITRRRDMEAYPIIGWAYQAPRNIQFSSFIILASPFLYLFPAKILAIQFDFISILCSGMGTDELMAKHDRQKEQPSMKETELLFDKAIKTSKKKRKLNK
jgi:hypothetical protein